MKTKTNVAKTNVAKTNIGRAGKRVAQKVVGSDPRAKSANGVAPTATGFLPGSKKRKDAAFGVEHTKPSNSRTVIRATEGKRWTARQQGRG